MSSRPGMTSHNIEVGRGSGFKIMKALSLFSFLFVFTVILSGFNVSNSSAADCDCTVCHGTTVKYHGDGLSNPGNSWTACSTCHASPPATGSHSVHSAPLSNTTYGDTVTNTAGQYQFGCGHCHSMAVTLHRNDTKDVSLFGSSIGQSGLQACNECHGSNAPGDHGATCPTIITNCASCHSGHTTGHMSTSSATITPSKKLVDCSSCHTQYASGLHAGTARDTSNSCGACHTAGLSFASHSAVPITADAGQCTTCHVPNHTSHIVNNTRNNCIVCHSATPRERPSVSNCIACHGNKPFDHDAEPIASSCSDCHTTVGGVLPNFCGDCHEDRSGTFHSTRATNPSFAAFSASAGSGTNAWTVTLNTTGSMGTISTVDWGDGTTNTSTTHAYTSAGVKSITLTVGTATTAKSITLYNYPISGTVKKTGTGISNVAMTLSGSTSGSTVTDANGAYSFSVKPGTYSVHASKSGYTISADVTGIVAAPGKTDANFTATGQEGAPTTGPVKRVSGAADNYHQTLADALTAAVDGDVIYLTGITFNEIISYDKTGVTVTLKGGYDSSFNTVVPGSTSISGPLDIIRGTLDIDNIVIY